MKKVIRLIFLVLGLGVLLGCFRKRPGNLTLSDWLEREYPGRFQVVSSYIEDPVKNLSFKRHRSVIAEINDPAVQLELIWDKRAPDLSLTRDAIDSSLVKAKENLRQVEIVLESLQRTGLTEFAVGCYGARMYVLMFAEPTASRRQQSLELIERALQSWADRSNYFVQIAFSEQQESQYHSIYPTTFWSQPSAAYRPYFTWEYEFPEANDRGPHVTAGVWRYNTNSHAFDKHLIQARELVKTWAAGNIRKSIVLLPSFEYEQLEKSSLFRMTFGFAYSESQNGNEETAESAGYLIGEYDIDTGNLEKIRITKEPSAKTNEN